MKYVHLTEPTRGLLSIILTVLNYIQMELVTAICVQVKSRVTCNKFDAQFSHQLSATEHRRVKSDHDNTCLGSKHTPMAKSLSFSCPIIYCTQLQTRYNHTFILRTLSFDVFKIHRVYRLEHNLRTITYYD